MRDDERELALGIMEGHCTRHNVRLVVGKDGWAHCPKSTGRAKVWTNVSDIIIEIEEGIGRHVLNMPIADATHKRN